MLQTETFENETRLEINAESIKTNLKDYNKNPYKCLFEYIWNAYDAQAETVNIIYKEDNLSFGGLKKLEIIDNGKGWDFNSFNTKTFLASSKKEISSNYKSIPHGRMGRGRYAFIWISDSIDILSGNKLLTLDTTTKYKISEMSEFISGTKVIFNNPKQLISNALIDNPDFEKKLVAEFGWFLKQNPLMQIKINGVNIDLEQSIEQVVTLHLADFSYQMQSKLNNDFKVKIILWKDKPNEFSKFYFLNLKNYEIFKENTGGNNNGDDFWHSIYIITDLFGIDAFDPNDSEMTDLFSGDSKHLKKNLLIEIKQKLVELRKPYLENRAQAYTAKLEKDKLLPNLQAYGVYDKPAFISLIEKAYTISPSLFKQKSDSEKKFICATFANLLSTQDNDLLQKIMNELADLSEEEKDDFAEILSRTKLSNIIKMTKIVDHRLDVIDKLKILITDFNKDTKEVLHLQKILNENFWIFGEQFELVSTTEGPLKKTLLKYAKEILMIENPELTTQPTGEVDLFLSKKRCDSENKQTNIIVELKRASITLKKETEYAQIERYCENVTDQVVCNSDNQYWEFYLIGKNYDIRIGKLIEGLANHGEKYKGLAYWADEGRVKIYVRKWSDILEVEWGYKMKYLKESLCIDNRPETSNAVDDIVESLISKH